MKSILSIEEKKYLNRVCRYLGSLGMKDGSIEIDLDNSYFDCDDFVWEHVTHFSNNFSAEVPEGLIPILQKIFNHICNEDLFEAPDVDYINYERINIDIDCTTKELSVNHDYSYYESAEVESISHSLEEDDDDENLKEVFETLENDEDLKDRQLVLHYNGGGDSGYLEDDFTNGDSVPTDVEDYCYEMLENNFGGWEINEGSHGNFQIDLDKKEITLNHISNIEENARNTIWEEKF